MTNRNSGVKERNIFSHSVSIFSTVSLTLHNPPQSLAFINVSVSSESILQYSTFDKHCLE